MGLPKRRPQTARVAPNERAPTSPSQILAGQMLKYKKAIRAPIRRPKNVERVVSKIERDMTKNAIKEIVKSPAAKPSSPSEILTDLMVWQQTEYKKLLNSKRQKNGY